MAYCGVIMAKREKEHSLERFNFFHQTSKKPKKLTSSNVLGLGIGMCFTSVMIALALSAPHVKKDNPVPIMLSDTSNPVMVMPEGEPMRPIKINESSVMMQTALEAVNVVMDTPQDMSAIKGYMTEDGFALYQQEMKDAENQEIINFHPDKIKVENITLSEIKDNRYFMFVDVKESAKSLEKKASLMVVLQKNIHPSDEQKRWEVSSLQFVHGNKNEIIK